MDSDENIEEQKNVKKLIKKVISTESPDDKYYLALELSDLYDNISFGKLGISHKCTLSKHSKNKQKHKDYSFAEWLISNDNPLNKTKYALSLKSVFEINNLVIKTASEYVKNQFIDVNGESFPFLKLVLYSYKFYENSTHKLTNAKKNTTSPEYAYQNYFRNLNISFSCKYRNIDITVYLYSYVIDMQSSNYPIKLKAGICLRTPIGPIFQKAWWSFL